MSTEQDNQFTRVARRIDGEDIELTPAELELLDEFKRNEATVGGQLGVEVPREVVLRARRGMIAAAVGKPRSVRIFRLAAATAVAALLVLSVGLYWSYFIPTREAAPSGVSQISPDAADIAATEITAAIEEQLAMQEEEEVLVLLEPLYDDNSAELWNEYDDVDEYDEYDKYLDFNGA